MRFERKILGSSPSGTTIDIIKITRVRLLFKALSMGVENGRFNSSTLD